MTDLRTRYADLLAVADDEVATRGLVRDVDLPSGATLALITLDNGHDYKRPNTLGPRSLVGLGETFAQQRERAARGEIDALAITGKRFNFAAGADLSRVNDIPSREVAALLGRLGHEVLGALTGFGVPTFTFYNGLALGGGVEIGLNCDYRTIDASVPAFALPEVFLGLVPGWGGATILPNLIGIENALKVVIENPLKQNRMLKGPQVAELGIADVMFEPVNFLEDSLRWADEVITGARTPSRPHEPGKLERLAKWDIAIGIARKSLEEKIGTTPASPYRALDLLKLAKSNDRAKGFAAEDDALADLISGDQFIASIYAFNLVQKRAKKPAGAPDATLAKPVTKVGIVGAGLMASQFATLFVRRLQVPVVITDVDQARVEKGLDSVRGELQELADKGRIGPDEHNRLIGLLRGTTDRREFADCDWVIEAVFEELEVKQQVFRDIEQIVADDCILATNTSGLSIPDMASVLEHPNRLVGFHFFNPVAVMPLIEVVKTGTTDDTTLATAMRTAKALKKTAIITRDTPGFVVNRILAKVLGEAMRAVDTGTPFEVVDNALDDLGMPMSPFELLELVGLKVGAHVLDTNHAAFPDRFYRSENLHRLADYGKLFDRDGKGKIKGFDKQARKIVAGGSEPITAEEFQQRVEVGLADEIKRMLDDNVVAAAEDIDLCMILGAGWPFHAGGITPYLDRAGASQRAFGDTFHHPPLRGAAHR
ncbi:3-hydroxyacyl-CoA dehydrogenase [Pseudoclavibacter endophyticus]|uniref:3-hydroxyacyl-CoA dehydrogenase n=1 Tax=Pseudoclavibacter endophyticus TaxID=1778590 RepID=A0A6H9WPJ0_9MICO|nr:3-hydroxyacyl-CoA dehydrogenase NAD-binding domain-containing protein [Pseudoclavibacter endophyticus]KAB1650038.1 3-hydroxyacyl-CoA dehydrogenase [Pseudoclavibacter endophyticus]GGA57758.1 3-hydroxyacyl-CoA dehydrogenase [Pseudoclavibacter endophyticus]